MLVDNGRFNLGSYAEPFTDINPLDARLKGLLGKIRWYKWMRLKEWQHFALVNRNYFVSLALFNAKILAFAQVCIHHRRNKSLLTFERKAPPWSITLPGPLFNSRVRYRGKGFSLSVHNLLAQGCHRIEFEIAPQLDTPGVRGRFCLDQDMTLSQPMVVCMPLADGRAIYTHKFMSPLEGLLTLNGREESFEKNTSYGLIDIHKGYYPRIMKWHWATGGGLLGKKRIGFNLTDNQVEDQARFNENCIWIDGRLFLLPPVTFNFDPLDPMQPWRVQDREGMVDLTFTPSVIRLVDINLWAVANRYRAPLGNFSGTLKTQAGRIIAVRDFHGMCENMFLKA
jgi:hypothetical protein